MNILLISRCPPYPLHLGDRLIPYHLAQELSKQHSIDLLAFYDQPDDPSNIEHYKQFFRSVKLIREPRRSTAQMIGRAITPSHLFPHTATQAWSGEMWQAITAQLAAQHYDIVQLFGGIQVYEYRELIRTLPNLIVPYESYRLYLSRLLKQQSNPVRWLTVWLQLQAVRRYERAMFDGYDGVVVLSHKDAQALASLNGNLPIHVIPNGIDLSYFTPAYLEVSEPIMIFVGNFDYAPNLDAALFLAQEMFPLIKREVSAARLLLVGNNPSKILRQLASSDIEVTGLVPDVRPYLQQTMVFISPLRFGAGIKNKVLEAMAMGKPLVATPLSGEGIGLVEGTNVLYGTTTDELAVAAIRLLRDSVLRSSMGVANRQLIQKNFTWQGIAEQYETLYTKIMRSHR